MNYAQSTFRVEVSDTNLEAASKPKAGKSRRSGGRHQMAACTSCKKKRKKCDGRYPVCGGCLRSKLECTILDITTNRVIPRNYIQTLEERVTQLESENSRANSVIESQQAAIAAGKAESLHSVAGHRISVSSAASIENPTPNDDSSDSKQSDSSFVKDKDLEMEIGYITLGVAAESRFMGDSSAFSIAKAITNSLDYYKKENFSSSHYIKDKRARPQLEEFDIPFVKPSLQAGLAYLNSYKIIVQCQYPFLDWEWVEQCFNEVMNGKEENPESMFFIYMVFAIGSQVSSANRNQYSTAAYTKVYYNKAMEYIGPIVEINTIRTVQAYLIISTFSQKMPDGSSIWQSTGLAIRTAVALGLHRQPYRHRNEEDLSPCVKKMFQLRYRIFWCAYGLERINGIVLGRPFGISDTDIDAPMPAESPETLVACHVFKLRRILSSICTFVYKPVAIMDSPDEIDTTRVQIILELNEWVSTFPAIAQPISVFETRNWCQISYHNAMILLLRPVVLEVSKLKSQATPRLLEWFKVFTQSASAICMNYKDLHAKGKLDYTWLAMHCVFVGGLSFLYCLWLDTYVKVLEWKSRGSIYDTISACSSILYVFAERFSTATVFRDSYERIYKAVLIKIDGFNGASADTENYSLPNVDYNFTTGVLDEQSIGIDQFLDFENGLLPSATPQERGMFTNSQRAQDTHSVSNGKGECPVDSRQAQDGKVAFDSANDTSIWEFLDNTGDKFLRSIYYDMENTFVAR